MSQCGVQLWRATDANGANGLNPLVGQRGFAHADGVLFTYRQRNREARGAAFNCQFRASIRPRTTRQSPNRTLPLGPLGCYNGWCASVLVINHIKHDTVFPNPDRLTGFQVAPFAALDRYRSENFVCVYSAWTKKKGTLTITRQ